jgi:hypothetical protein
MLFIQLDDRQVVSVVPKKKLLVLLRKRYS